MTQLICNGFIRRVVQVADIKFDTQFIQTTVETNI